MSAKMTRWGVGPHLTLLTFGYAALTVLVWRLAPDETSIDFVPYWVLATTGAVLLAIGLPSLRWAAISAMRAYDADDLATQGLFRLCRHPIYASWVVFLVPGAALLTGSWVVLTVCPVMYVGVRILVRREEAYLEQEFGQAYLDYKARVPAILPLGWLRR